MEKIHNTTDKILELLLSNKGREFTIRAIARNVSVDYKAVYLNLKRLIGNNAINAKKAGQAILCSVNQKDFSPDIFRAEYLRRQDILANKDIYGLYKRIMEDVKEPSFILLLFGSYASGKARKGSDIDLMLITAKASIKNEVSHILSLLPLKTHLLDFSPEEFLSMLKTTDFNVGKEAFNNNIILFGIEDYYRLIQNV